MISKDKITFGKEIYFTPTYGCLVKVKILRLFDNDTVLVQGKNAPFVRALKYVYTTPKAAKKGGRDWEHYERKRRRNKKRK